MGDGARRAGALGRREAARRPPAPAHPWQTDLDDRARGPPLTLYVDTSALLKLYVEEDGSAAVREWLSATSHLASSALAYVEARAALARRHRARALSATEYRAVVRELDVDWPRYLAIEPSEAVRSDAVRLAAAYALRGYDAMHLASAMTVRRQLADDRVAFASWDDELDAAAAREGFEVLRSRRR